MGTEETRKVIQSWMDEQLTIGVRAASKKYVAENVISHSPVESSGIEAGIAYIEDEFSRGLKFTIHKIIADGDFAAVHMHFKFADATPDQAIVDLWRVEDGKLVEIWDHQQVIPSTTVSGNPMVSAPPSAPDVERSRTQQAAARTSAADVGPSHRRLVEDWMTALATVGVRAACERYVRDDYKQHNPTAPDGREGAIAHLKAERARGAQATVHRLLCDGDFVLTHQHKTYADGSPDQSVIDIWRIEDGKLAEHWDVAKDVPEVCANPMF